MSMKKRVFFILAAIAMSCFSPSVSAGQQSYAGIGVGNWLTFAANFPEAGYRKTDFFRPHYNIGVFQWDSRIELWLPPFRNRFSWGPYVKLTGIAQSATAAYPNAWLGGPGVGFQAYPLSSWRFQRPTSKIGAVFGPLRLFAEYNRISFLGAENSWRPRSQVRAGFEYWKAMNVNEPADYWWAEIWNGLYWQSSNEFTDRYDSVIFANAWRSGIRKPHSGALSSITPYLAVVSSRTKYDRTGTQHCVFDSPTAGPNPCDFYWENGLLVGGGLRFAPPLPKPSPSNRAWLSRFVVYGEYLNTAMYYGPAAPSSIPRFDVSVGVSASIGDWYSRR
jgi:hypothetical protein